MNKRGLLILLMMMVLTLAACTNQAGVVSSPTPAPTPAPTVAPTAAPTPTPTPDIIEAKGESKILIAYFSSAGNIVTDSEPRGNVGHGNTKTIADMIQGQVGGDLFFIETVDKYPANYNNTIDVAMQEQRANARPALATHVENMDDYDVVFIGFPNWWGTMPQAVFTFLEEYDFSGKTVIPFCTHEGSGFGRSTGDLASTLPDATILDGFVVRGASANNAGDDVAKWISGLNLSNAVSAGETAAKPEGSDAKMLVAYFSMPETNDPNNMTRDEDNSAVVINGEVLGNTQYVAQLIQENTGADIFRIERKEPYPTDHATLLDVASEEQSNDARPELSASVENIEQYDVIFVGYPNWWADMPQVIYTFLEEYDLSGKTIVPFNTHGGSGFSNTINTIAELQPNALVERNGFTVSRNSVDRCEGDVIAWLNSLKH